MTPQQIISDEKIAEYHCGNFGSMGPRRVVDEGVVKTGLGYHSGSTVRKILTAHGLAFPVGDDLKLTLMGQDYFRALISLKGIDRTLNFLYEDGSMKIKGDAA